MKSAILVKSKKPLVIDEVMLPKELEFGQVLVKIFYSGICGSQINEIDSIKEPDKYLPHLLGTRIRSSRKNRTRCFKSKTRRSCGSSLEKKDPV